jgi:hypothetical protein
MKIITPFSIQKILVFFCLFILGNTYSQVKSPSNKMLFDKAVNTENANPKNGYIRCATTEYEKFLQEKNPKRMSDAQFEAWVTPLVKHYKALRTSTTSKTVATIITIPVVVHVIHNGQAIGIAPNITDAQVQSQIEVLNQDFRKLAGSPGFNTNPIGADTQIEFALAQQDPTGNPTNGIDRVSFCQDSWSRTDIDATLKPATIWDPAQYMNMWSVQFSDNTLLGYAQFPDGSGSGLTDLNASGGNANSDGVVSNYTVFGSNDYNDGTFLLNPTFNKGRTMTHEVGHWLGLRHIWGDSACGTDYCADTPVHHKENYGCPQPIPLSCDPIPVPEMIQNYMDYTDDACMNIFTQNQKDRITAIINNSARRSSLKTSTKISAPALFANDAQIKLEASCATAVCGTVPNQTIQKVTIYNRGTSNLTSATINYTINGAGNTVYNWSGSLPIHKSATFNITINSASNGTISVSITKANGVTDQRASNNTASGTFIIPTAASNYTFTNYVFKLQQDYWGSETTWSLKNSSGTTIHSGGPYTDTYVNDATVSKVPALITENWTLDSNQCYTLTINDSAGDGICCGAGLGGSGDGYYDLKSTDGSTVVKSGASFSSFEKTTFSTNSLGNNEFETSEAIFLYPNPTKGTLNIQIPSNFGLPNSYSIYNILGQIISKKEVSKETDLTVNTSSLSNGIYFITVVKENEKKTLRFIKQ